MAAASCAVAPARLERLEGRLLFSTYTVTTLGDAAGSVTPDGAGKFNATTLRAAITATEHHAGADTVRFAASLAGTIKLTKTLPTITGMLAIAGPGQNKLAISGENRCRVFDIEYGADVTISALTIRNANAGDGDYGVGGGAVARNSGNLTFNDVALTHNAGFQGAVVYNFDYASLTINHSTVTDTAVVYAGGAIYNRGVVRISYSTFSRNSTSQIYGGAIMNIPFDIAAQLYIDHSTFSDNWAQDAAGAIANWGYGSTVSITDSTLSGNRALDNNGGAISCGDGGPIIIANCTFAGNTAPLGGAIGTQSYLSLTNSTFARNSATDDGGALYVFSEYGPDIIANNTILAGNTVRGAANDVVSHLDPASSANLIGVGGGLTNGVHGNRVGVTAARLHLGPLAWNRGPTKTMALLPGSVAVDAGYNSRAVGIFGKPLVTDQRGRTRIANGRVDIGAYEAAAVVKFYLVDAATGRRLMELKNGTTVRLSSLSAKSLNIEAVTSPAAVGSVQFHFDGRVHIENLPPYGAFGTHGPIFVPGALSAGSHKLSATPFDQQFGLGAAGTSLAVQFTVVR
jgi:hypothetical protein